MRCWLAIVWMLAACGSGAAPDPGDQEVTRAAAAIAATPEPAAAAAQVTALARRGCAGLRRALAALARSQISGRLLSGLVDDAVAAADGSGCGAARAADALAGERSAPFQLARARAAEARPGEALAQLAAGDAEPAVHLRRAELLAALDRTADALAELERFLARFPGDGLARATRVEGLLALHRPADAVAAAGPGPHRDPVLREAAVAALAAAGRLREAAAAVAAAELPERPALSRRIAAAAPLADLERLAGADAANPTGAAAATGDRAPLDVELLAVIADRVEAERGAAAAVVIRERAAGAAPERADLADALARALVAAGRIDPALAAWDRAAAAAPAAPAYRLAPIRALAAAGLASRARARARSAAAAARRAGDAESLTTASDAAAAAAATDLALALAREARAARPGDGRLVMLVGERQAGAGDRSGAAATWTALLVCGAHGRAYHRHEVAARLVRLAADPPAAALVERALAARPPCAAADPDGLASYLAEAKNQLEAAK
ncbi:MAG TPA: hypothetical protein VK698_21885, partial [Kofleriaceae bacterium]|nr:hypothetical protein [Kofleriaceae bacterium]